jgi:hypothetical protein
MSQQLALTLKVGGVLESGVFPVELLEPGVDKWEIVSDYKSAVGSRQR